jgi:hypothetical protein
VAGYGGCVGGLVLLPTSQPVYIQIVAKSKCLGFHRYLTLQLDYNTSLPGQGSCLQTLAACSIFDVSTHSANGWRPQCARTGETQGTIANLDAVSKWPCPS